MSENPKVLIGCPTYDGMQYCIDKFLTRIKELDYDNYDILMVENSEGNEFFNELQKKVPTIKYLSKNESNIDKLIKSRNKIIEYALENNYDYLLAMDQDVIPPKNVIKELLNCNKDVVSGLYFNYFQSSGQIKYLPVAWAYITPEEYEEIKKQVTFPPAIKSHLDLRRHLTKKEVESNALLRVKYPSAGCMLLKKKVFEKVRYGLLNMSGINAKTSDDVYFIEKAREAGFEIYCHTKIRCEHLALEKLKKDKEGNLIHPVYE